MWKQHAAHKSQESDALLNHKCIWVKFWKKLFQYFSRIVLFSFLQREIYTPLTQRWGRHTLDTNHKSLMHFWIANALELSFGQRCSKIFLYHSIPHFIAWNIYTLDSRVWKQHARHKSQESDALLNRKCTWVKYIWGGGGRKGEGGTRSPHNSWFCCKSLLNS